MPRIIPNDKSRVRSRFQSPSFFSAAGAIQIRSSADCNSPNTVVAPSSSVATPTSAPMALFPGLLALSTIPSMAVAPSSPIIALQLAEDLPGRGFPSKHESGNRR